MEWELKVVSSVVGVPALSRRASARATERKVFIAKGPAQTQAATRRGIRTPDDMVLWRLGAAAATSAKASEAAGGAAPRSNVERHSGASEARTPKG